MNKLSKLATGAGVAALFAFSAAPAQAQYYPYPDRRDGIDYGEIARGVAVAGAAAAAVGAIANATRGALGGGYGYPQGGYGYPQGGYGYPQGGYGYPQGGYAYPNAGYGYGNQGYERFAVDACGQRAARHGRVSITLVEPRSRDSLRVRGVVDGGGYNQGWGYNGGYERRSFTCKVRLDGRITDFDTDRIRY